MLRKNNAARLQETVRSVETMTRFALAVLSLASGVYTYLGVRGLLDGTATFVFFAAIIYSVAVSVAIYAFWTFMLKFVPLVTSGVQRAALFLTMAVGCFMIIAMSSWLNAAALAGSAALEQHLAVNLEGYVGDLDEAHGNALAAQSLLAGRAARRRSLRPSGRGRAQFGCAHRHHRLGLGGAVADPDVGADDRTRRHHHQFARRGADPVRPGLGASRQDARAGVGHRRYRAAFG